MVFISKFYFHFYFKILIYDLKIVGDIKNVPFVQALHCISANKNFSCFLVFYLVFQKKKKTKKTKLLKKDQQNDGDDDDKDDDKNNDKEDENNKNIVK